VNKSGLMPHLVVHDGNAALAFYEKGLGAEVLSRVPAPDGKRLMHAALAVGGSTLMLCDDFPEYCGGKTRAPKVTGTTGVTLHLNVTDCDAAIQRMADAGGDVVMPATDAFWGDRYGKVLDPFGHEWSFSHPLTEEQKAAAMRQWQEWQAATATASA
jgi:PhnB protein